MKNSLFFRTYQLFCYKEFNTFANYPQFCFAKFVNIILKEHFQLCVGSYVFTVYV